MSKKICSRCGQTILSDVDERFGKIKLETIENIWNMEVVGTQKAYLCAECMDSFNDWANKKPKTFPELDQ